MEVPFPLRPRHRELAEFYGIWTTVLAVWSAPLPAYEPVKPIEGICRASGCPNPIPERVKGRTGPASIYCSEECRRAGENAETIRRRQYKERMRGLRRNEIVELLNVELLPIVQIEDPTFRGWQPWTRWKKTTELMQKSIKARTAMLDELGYAEDFSTGYVCRKSLDEPGDEVATMGLARLNRELMSLDDRLRDLDEPDADEPDAEAA